MSIKWIRIELKFDIGHIRVMDYERPDCGGGSSVRYQRSAASHDGTWRAQGKVSI